MQKLCTAIQKINSQLSHKKNSLEFVAHKLPKIYIWIVVLGMSFYLLTNSVKFPAKKLD